MKVEGEHAERIIAFARELDGDWLVVVAARLSSPLLADSQIPQIPAQRWGDTLVRVPEALNGHAMERLFDGTTVTPKQAGLRVTEVLQQLPVAVLQVSISSTGESER